MNLKQLFSEGDFGTPSPQTPADVAAVIEVLKRAVWIMRLKTSAVVIFPSHDIEGLVKWLKLEGIASVEAYQFLMACDISRYDNNIDFVEPLRQVYYPNLDVPPTAGDEGFHVDDKFDVGDPMLLGFEFLIHGEKLVMGDIPLNIECVASLADTSEEVELPPPIQQYMTERFNQTLEKINSLLNQS